MDNAELARRRDTLMHHIGETALP